MVSSVEFLELLKGADELVTALSVDGFPEELETQQNVGSLREAL